MRKNDETIISKVAKRIEALANIDEYHGISIKVRTKNEHNPPHVHAIYNGLDASFDAETGEWLENTSRLPPSQMKRMTEWFKTRKDEKMKNWTHDEHGNWKKANIDFMKPWSKENDFMPLIAIQKLIPCDGHVLEIWFENGDHKMYDMTEDIATDMQLEPLMDESNFRKLTFTRFGVSWEDFDIDIDSFGLYVNGKEVND